MRRALFLALTLAPVVGAAVPPSQGCARCHAKQSAAHRATSMARALEPARGGAILRANQTLTFQHGTFRYQIERRGDQSIYTVTDGIQTLSVPIAWAFGLGAAGQTYVYEKDGLFYESRVSYYTDSSGLDLTLGARPDVPPKDVVEAAGRQMTNKDKIECFGCHSAGGVVQSKLRFDSMIPGVQCESCHEGAEKHVAGVQAGDVKAAAMPNLGKLSTEEMSELCGACHRTWAQVAAQGLRGIINVRFQPYRIANSQCYDPEDRRISCIACHDPHAEVDRNPAAYDNVCKSCHAPGAKTAKVCHTAKAECSSCHMPKYEIPGSHHAFSDHQIRIVRPHETYPN